MLSKTTLFAAAAGTLLFSTAARADVLVENLSKERYENQKVTVSGVVSWVEDANEFTVADRTGDIEVNLRTARTDINQGDYVTVNGILNPTMIDEIDAATVMVISNDYDRWNNAYHDTYGRRYDLKGFDTSFYNTTDWNNDIYDNSRR